MASLIFTIAGQSIGASIGGSFLGVSAATWGGAIGGLVGNLLFPQKLPDVSRHGPRLSDLTIQTSAYGRAIPWVRGTRRMEGNNIFWAPPLEEVPVTTTEEVGGKGGPSQTVSQTEYRYYASFALGLQSGEMAGVRRIWINKELRYSIDAMASPATVIASAELGDVAVYPGSETQAVDSVMEAVDGTGNTPAYLGTAYLRFNRLDVTQWRTIPPIDVETVSQGNLGPLQRFFEVVDASADQITNYVFYAEERKEIWGTYPKTNAPQVVIFDMVSQTTQQLDLSVLVSGIDGFTGTGPHGCVDNSNGIFWAACRNTSAQNIIVAIDMASKAVKFTWNASIVTAPVAVLNVIGQTMLARMSGSAGVRLYTWTEGGLSTLLKDPGMSLYYDVTVERDPEDIDGEWWLIASSTQIGKVSALSGGTLYTIPSSRTAKQHKPAISWSRRTMFFLATLSLTDYLMSIDLDTGAFNTLYTGSNLDDVNSLSFSEELDAILGQWWDEPSDTGGYRLFDPDTGALIADYNLPVSSPYSGGELATEFAHIVGKFCYTSARGYLQEFRFQVFQPDNPTLQSIVEDLCYEVGLHPSQVDATALGSVLVHDFALMDINSARSGLENLLMPYMAAAVEAGTKLVFFMRGAVPAVTITDDDLAADNYGTRDRSRIKVRRIQSVEVPKDIRVMYRNYEKNYLEGSQYARSQAHDGRDIQEIAMHVGLSDVEAAQIAKKLMFGTASARLEIEFNTTVKYDNYLPGTVMTIEAAGTQYTVYTTSKRNELPSLIRWRGVTEEPAIYSQSDAAAAEMPPAVSAVRGIEPALVEYMDIPLLRPEDEGCGIYVAMGPAARGCEIWKSTDGVNYNPTGMVLTATAAIGFASTALPNYVGGNTIDSASTVTVVLNPDSPALDSLTYAEFMFGRRAILIGNELVLCKEAELIATNTYKLSVFLRARGGTDQYLSTHAAGERVVVLSPDTVRRMAMSVADIGTTVYFKAVAFGRTLAQSIAKAISFQSVGQKPLSPINVEGWRDAGATNNWYIRCVRRDRMAVGWHGADTPMSEATLSFDWEFYDSTYAILKGTVANVTTEEFVYTSAEQFAHFGGNQTTLYYRVYQNSAQVGRGFYAQGVLS